MKATKFINDTYWPYYIFQHFIDSLEQLGYAETTRKSYQSQLKRFGAILIELGYKYHDESLTSLPIFYKTLFEHHKRLLKAAGRKGISNACLNQYISAWNRFCRWYVNSGVQKHTKSPGIATAGGGLSTSDISQSDHAVLLRFTQSFLV
ncbi:hypothetical protein [Neisseria weixii]|uniref:hypothetical protein n=1 Tax=Neisseria weixii TaxID=1853276 RepID=UPI000BB77176|nr:hypothetical protein [Neisseria weixii]ATD64899.1 hypothetical protein CGZ65_05440 [Neisseria weixii]